jgi:hemerythrin superfamily protein
MIFFRNKSKTNAALEIAKPLLKENPVITQEADIREKQKEENIEKISEWLGEGFRFLAEHNLEEAELIYKNLIKEYRKEFDEYGILQKRILSFYEEILAERREQENKK